MNRTEKDGQYYAALIAGFMGGFITTGIIVLIIMLTALALRRDY